MSLTHWNMENLSMQGQDIKAHCSSEINQMFFSWSAALCRPQAMMFLYGAGPLVICSFQNNRRHSTLEPQVRCPLGRGARQRKSPISKPFFHTVMGNWWQCFGQSGTGLMYYISRLNGLFPLWSSVSGFMMGQTGGTLCSFSHYFHYVSESHRCLTVCPSFSSLLLCYLYLLSLFLSFSLSG